VLRSEATSQSNNLGVFIYFTKVGFNQLTNHFIRKSQSLPAYGGFIYLWRNKAAEKYYEEFATPNLPENK
jgi:hypothetical protein